MHVKYLTFAQTPFTEDSGDCTHNNNLLRNVISLLFDLIIIKAFALAFENRLTNVQSASVPQ